MNKTEKGERHTVKVVKRVFKLEKHRHRWTVNEGHDCPTCECYFTQSCRCGETRETPEKYL